MWYSISSCERKSCFRKQKTFRKPSNLSMQAVAGFLTPARSGESSQESCTFCPLPV